MMDFEEFKLYSVGILWRQSVCLQFISMCLVFICIFCNIYIRVIWFIFDLVDLFWIHCCCITNHYEFNIHGFNMAGDKVGCQLWQQSAKYHLIIRMEYFVIYSDSFRIHLYFRNIFEVIWFIPGLIELFRIISCYLIANCNYVTEVSRVFD